MEAMMGADVITSYNNTLENDETKQREQLIAENRQLREEKDKLIRQNAKLLLLLKDREGKLTDAEIIIRKYRSRLVRWFEDMKYDPSELEIDKSEE